MDHGRLKLGFKVLKNEFFFFFFYENKKVFDVGIIMNKVILQIDSCKSLLLG
jgi:hypothetical protein